MEDHQEKHKGLMSTPKLMLDGLSDFMKKRRTPSMKKKSQEERKISAPAGLSQVLPVVGIVSTPGTSATDVKVFPEYRNSSDSPPPPPVGSPTLGRRPLMVIAPVAPMTRDQEWLDEYGRNLLNKKEAGPPSTIKESSESSQTIDDNDSEKGSGQLKHENTVVRADAGTSKVAALNSSSTAHPGLRSEIIRITEAIVQAVANKDFTTYSRLCDPTITLIGPETCGNIVEGIEFHRYQFEQHGMNNSVGSSSGSGRVQASLLNPHLHTMGEDGATIAYTVLTQYMDRDGMPRTRQTSESRVWHKKVGRWVCVHLHRSGPMEAL